MNDRYRILIILCAFIYLTVAAVPAHARDKGIEIYAFISYECDTCLKDYEIYVVPLIEKYRVQVIEFDVDKPINHKLLLLVEKSFGKQMPAGPVILFNDRLMGQNELEDGRFKDKIRSLKGRSSPFFDLSKLKKRTRVAFPEYKLKKTEAILFSRGSCRECGRVKRDLDHLQRRYSEFSYREFYIEDPESCLFYEYLGGVLHIPENKILHTPAVIIGDEYLIGDNINYTDMEHIVRKSRFVEGPFLYSRFNEKKKKEMEGRLLDKFRGITALPVFFGGLIDGINPCAFGAIVFFVTCLWSARKRKKDILVVGLSFIGIIFLTYFMIGAVLVRFMDFLLFLPTFKKALSIIYLAAASILFILAYLTLIDLIHYVKGKSANMALQLSEGQRAKIRQVISKNVRLPHIVAGASVAAFLVAITELGCTGQVYLPTILYVLRIEGLRVNAFWFLGLYNLAFIIPLVAVFILSFFGLRSYRLIRFARENVVAAKVLLFLCFFGLGIIFLFLR
jgi:hypothetical protein